MYKVWTASAPTNAEVARELETHLNEFASEVISVAYDVTVGGDHHVLAVYTSIELMEAGSEHAAVELAEDIVQEAEAG